MIQMLVLLFDSTLTVSSVGTLHEDPTSNSVYCTVCSLRSRCPNSEYVLLPKPFSVLRTFTDNGDCLRWRCTVDVGPCGGCLFESPVGQLHLPPRTSQLQQLDLLGSNWTEETVQHRQDVFRCSAYVLDWGSVTDYHVLCTEEIPQ